MSCSRLGRACALWAVASLLLVHSGADAEAPESKHRHACFHLDANRLAQAMWLHGALSHQVPSRFACSSLQGAACLHNQMPQPRLTDDLSTALLGSEEAAADGDTSTKMKLVLLKPGNEQGMKELLKKMEKSKGLNDVQGAAASRDQQQAAQQLLEDNGEVVFEGNPASLSDVDSVVQTMLAAMGIPESGQFADSLKRQLAKSLTEAEFAQTRGKNPKQDAADGDRPGDGINLVSEDGSNTSNDDGGGSSTGSTDSEASSAGSRPDSEDKDVQDDFAVSVRKLLNDIRAAHRKHAGTADAEGGQQLPADEAPANRQHAARPALDQGPEPEAVQPAHDEPQKLLAGQPRRRSGGRSGGQRHGGSKQRPPQAADAAGADAGAAAEKVYIDDETGEQFVLPDERVPEGEERVYVDDRTGHTYVVTDDGADAGGSGRTGRLSRRLNDNMSWLDGLTDEQYEEYMDHYYDELDREDAAREERQRQSAGHVDL